MNKQRWKWRSMNECLGEGPIRDGQASIEPVQVEKGDHLFLRYDPRIGEGLGNGRASMWQHHPGIQERLLRTVENYRWRVINTFRFWRDSR